MTAYKQHTHVKPLTVRFNYIPEDAKCAYKGQARLSEERDDAGNLLRRIEFESAYQIGLSGYTEIFPDNCQFPPVLRAELEQAALDAAMYPPAYPISLPSDWEPFKINGVKTEYDIDISFPVPAVKSDQEARQRGLSAVKRIAPTGKPGNYLVTASGGVAEVLRELQAIELPF